MTTAPAELPLYVNPEKSRMTEADILDALQQRHWKDVFVRQCKNGPTYMTLDTGLRIFDAWVLRRSYKDPGWIGYEVKTSRCDFFRDSKLQEYFPFCAQLYIACPTKMLAPAEIPDQIGLMYVNESGKTRIKKHAAYRKIEPPVFLYEYILISRATIRRREL